jgi:hypothetical protein|tara:strand:+ start:463 stop:741 length:279 start_codon:yes stop_codon:yes gene_type:complete
MKLYHGTKSNNKEQVADFPKASKAANGLGFYLSNNKQVAEQYGSVIEYEVNNDWKCNLMRTIEVNGNKGIEFVLSQREADELVVTHAVSINY